MLQEKRSWLLKGDIFMTMKHKDGTVEKREMHNVIVDDASLLMAQLMKENSGVPGIMALAIGTGDIGWDLQNPPIATAAEHTLVNEIFRAYSPTGFTSTYIDPGTLLPTLTRTNIVDYEATFGETEAVGTLVEMGLFGGTGYAVANGGTMINAHNFPVWNKPSTSSLVVVWRLTF